MHAPGSAYTPPCRASRLSDTERTKAEAALVEPRLAGKTAAHIVATLANEGIYVCSAATLTRIRRARRAAPPGPDAAKPERPRRPAPRLCATGPNQVWVWDITLLPATVRGRFHAMGALVHRSDPRPRACPRSLDQPASGRRTARDRRDRPLVATLPATDQAPG